MDKESRVAFIQSQCSCMNAELVSMQVANEEDRQAGRPLTYASHDFCALPDRFGLGHNTVVSYLLDS